MAVQTTLVAARSHPQLKLKSRPLRRAFSYSLVVAAAEAAAGLAGAVCSGPPFARSAPQPLFFFSWAVTTQTSSRPPFARGKPTGPIDLAPTVAGLNAGGTMAAEFQYGGGP